jgi:pimeloyl-ACP methyl ester carboxylesterase
MTTATVHSSTSASTPHEIPAKSRIGLVVATCLLGGLALGLLLVLGLFAGRDEPLTIACALFALGTTFASLALASTRFTNQPQQWALRPGLASLVAGVVVALVPGERFLDLAGWVWPLLLATLVVSSFRGARRSLHNWSRGALLYPALAVLLLIAVGGTVGTVMAATSSNPAPSSGRTYMVNGHQLYLNCTGSGGPTVVLFNGLGEWTPSWAWVQANVSHTTRVCSFDRAGEGWSTGKAMRQDGHQLASDLHALLRTSHVPGPYVLAGHSVGGTYALVYANDYPAEVTGVALIDSATPYQFEIPEYRSFYSMWKRVSALLPTAARTGLGKLTLRSGFSGLPPRARDAARAFNASPHQQEAARLEFLQLPTVFNQAKALDDLHGKPLGVLTATAGQMSGWRAAQDKLARLSRNGFHRTAVGATHEALLEDKAFAQMTSRAITEVVSRAQSGRRS